MKRIALLLALLMLMLCCVGCGGDEKTDGEQGTTGAAAHRETTIAPGDDLEISEVCPEAEDGKHQFEEEVISETTCTDNGVMMYTCLLCMESTTKEIPAPGHDGSGASCEEPSVCAVCWEIAEEAWGHEDEGGVCKRCGIDMSEIPATPQVTVPAETVEETVEATTGQ